MNNKENIEETVRDLESEVKVINNKVETAVDKIDDIKEIVNKQTSLLEKFVIWQERQTYLASRVGELEEDFTSYKEVTKPILDEATTLMAKVKVLLAVVFFVATVCSGYITWRVQYNTEKAEALQTDMVIQKTKMDHAVSRIEKLENK